MTKRPRQFTLAFSLLFFLLLPSSLFAAGLQLSDISSMIQQGKTAEARVEIDKKVAVSQGDTPLLFRLEALRTESYLKDEAWDTALIAFGGAQGFFGQSSDTVDKKMILNELKKKMQPAILALLERVEQFTDVDDLEGADHFLQSIVSIDSRDTAYAKTLLKLATIKGDRGLLKEAEIILQKIINPANNINSETDLLWTAFQMMSGTLMTQGKFIESQKIIDDLFSRIHYSDDGAFRSIMERSIKEAPANFALRKKFETALEQLRIAFKNNDTEALKLLFDTESEIYNLKSRSFIVR